MAVFVLDSFTASGGAAGNPGDLLTAHTGEIGATWTDLNPIGLSDVLLTAAGRVRPEVSGGSIEDAVHFPSGVPPSPDYYVQTTLHQLTVTTQGIGIVARWQNAGVYYVLYYNPTPGTVDLWRVADAGILTLLLSVSSPLTNGASMVLRLELIGAALSVVRDGGVLGSVTDSTPITAAGVVGLRNITATTTATTGVHWDDFSAGTIGADPTPVPRPQSRWRSVRR